jgi:hypothetical protein
MGPEVMLGATAASTLVSAIGGIGQGSAAARTGRYQAQVARNNAQIAQQNAEYASQAGETTAQAQDLKARSALGSIKAAQSASGLSVDSPSLQDAYEGSAQVYRLDTANIVQNAALRARSYEAKGTEYLAEAALDERKAGDAQTAGYLGAAGSLLSGASSFADKWAKYKPL